MDNKKVFKQFVSDQGVEKKENTTKQEESVFT